MLRSVNTVGKNSDVYFILHLLFSSTHPLKAKPGKSPEKRKCLSSLGFLGFFYVHHLCSGRKTFKLISELQPNSAQHLNNSFVHLSHNTAVYTIGWNNQKKLLTLNLCINKYIQLKYDLYAHFVVKCWLNSKKKWCKQNKVQHRRAFSPQSVLMLLKGHCFLRVIKQSFHSSELKRIFEMYALAEGRNLFSRHLMALVFLIQAVPGLDMRT